jgi:hypothetical protein
MAQRDDLLFLVAAEHRLDMGVEPGLPVVANRVDL